MQSLNSQQGMGNKPFSRTELKILVFNKMKQKGMSYDDARAEVTMEVEQVRENSKKEDKKNGQ